MWLGIVVILAPLAAVAMYPDMVSPFIQRAFEYPLDVGWLLLYSTLFTTHVWRETRADLRVTVTVISGLVCLATVTLYALLQTQNLWAVALVVPPIVAAISLYLQSLSKQR
jgi:hypothetical protein